MNSKYSHDDDASLGLVQHRVNGHQLQCRELLHKVTNHDRRRPNWQCEDEMVGQSARGEVPLQRERRPKPPAAARLVTCSSRPRAIGAALAGVTGGIASPGTTSQRIAR